VQKDADQKRSAFSQNIGACTLFHSLPSSPFHHLSSVILFYVYWCKKSCFI
jgi:hypothetical protein